jgi:hypothetical protein
LAQNTPSNKRDLFQRVRDEYTKCLELLAQVKSQGKQHEMIGNWTVFEMLKHLAGWAVWRVKATKDLLNNRPTDFSHFKDNDGFNAKIVVKRANRSWDQIVQEVRDAEEEWIELLESLNPEDIFISKKYRSLAWETLSEWIKIAYEHYIYHANILRVRALGENIEIVSWEQHYRKLKSKEI